MIKKLKDKLDKRKKKKSQKPGKLVKILAGDKAISAINIHIFMEGEDAVFRITTKEECQDLHFEEISFQVQTLDKKMNIKGKFKSADQKKSFYLYDFIIIDYREFFT